jgi:hypothetical protein
MTKPISAYKHIFWQEIERKKEQKRYLFALSEGQAKFLANRGGKKRQIFYTNTGYYAVKEW